MVTWWYWNNSFNLIFSVSCFIFLLSHRWILSISQKYPIHHSGLHQSLNFYPLLLLSILVNPWLTSPGSWYQDLLIPVCPIHNYSKCVTEIFSLVTGDDFIRDYGANTKQATLSNFCKIASIILFRFIISYIFLYNIVLLLFGCCHFLQRNKFWVQIIFVRWVLQDIIFVSLLIWIRMPYLLESSETATWGYYCWETETTLWSILSYFDTSFTTPNDQLFLHFVILHP